VFILPVDIPLVRPATLHLLLKAFSRQRPSDATIHPVFDGQRGHPPLIPADLIPAIQSHDGAGGLRAILEAPGTRAVEVQVPDRFILQDMDYPERYAAMMQALVDHDIPNDAECEVLLGATWGVTELIQRHSRLVAASAGAIAEALGRTGVDLNLGLVRAGALLHDIAKGEKGHAQAGAQRLRQLQFDRVAAIVAHHDDVTLTGREALGEAEVVFVVDKHISNTQIIPMEARFALALERFGDIPAARRNILRRRDTARAIRDTIEAHIQMPLAELITQAVQDCDVKAEADKLS
jgi:putative nucleotidyltransferase with HDIG domain